MLMRIWYVAIVGCVASACDYGDPICPRGQKTIQWNCPSGHTRVLQAFWGRDPADTTTCVTIKHRYDEIDNVRTKACPGDDQKAMDAVTSLCDANVNEAGDCVITAPAQKLRWDGQQYDPCPGTLKYLKVCSSCKPNVDRVYVDTHFHLWELKRFHYDWPSAEQDKLFRDVTIDEYSDAIKDTPIKHSVYVQVLNNHVEESRWVVGMMQQHPFIKGVVAGLDLTDPQLSDTLDSFGDKVVGCRHILGYEEPDWLFTNKEVHRGLGVLEERGLTFDLLVRPDYLKPIPELAKKFPNLRMVIDHIAKPLVKDRIMTGWKEDIAAIAAQCPKISCKISGLVNEGNAEDGVEDYRPYVEHVLQTFGPDRCFFGTDFPVFKQNSWNLKGVISLAENLTSHLTQEEKDKIFSRNAIRFYNLKGINL